MMTHSLDQYMKKYCLTLMYLSSKKVRYYYLLFSIVYLITFIIIYNVDGFLPEKWEYPLDNRGIPKMTVEDNGIFLSG